MTKEKIIETIKTSKSKSEVCRKLKLTNNGASFKLIDEWINEYKLSANHFSKNANHFSKYKIVIKDCPVCKDKFETKIGHPREKETCSRSCANTYFRSGDSNPNWKEDTYRTTCFQYHDHKCVVCDENKILDVHHYDGNRENNKKENLIPLCPTHHRYWHSKYRNIIEKLVNDYRDKFISKNE